MSNDKFILKKYILPEEQDGLTCPLCKHPISCTGGIGHSCYLDSKNTNTKIFWCNHCHLEILIPLEDPWATNQRRREL